MNRFVLFLAVVGVATAFPATGRNIPWPDYDKYFAQSDFVVIAQPVTETQDTGERTASPEFAKKLIAIGVSTQFESLLVLKGAKEKQFTLHHYRYEQLDQDKVVVNGPSSMAFKSSSVHDETYLMFLVRERDGRFAPVAGQTDPENSVQLLSRFRGTGLTNR